MELQRYGAAKKNTPETKEIPTLKRKRLRKMGRAAWGIAQQTWNRASSAYSERKAAKESKSTDGEKQASRLKKFGDKALARFRSFADLMPTPASTPTEKRKSLDDEQPTHPNAAPLGDGNNEPVAAPEVVDVAEASADKAPASHNPLSYVAPKSVQENLGKLPERQLSERVEALFDPYELADENDENTVHIGESVYKAALDKEGNVLTSENDTPLRKKKENGVEIKFVYDEKNITDEQKENYTPALNELIQARAALAEASFASRKGRLLSKKDKHADALEAANTAYTNARATYFEEIFDTHATDLSSEEQNQLAVSFLEREQGALAGEEAHHYLKATANEIKGSRLKQWAEKYNDMSRGKKILVGIGAAGLAGLALAPLGASLIGAGAAAGATYGSRLALNSYKAYAGTMYKREKQATNSTNANLDKNQLSTEEFVKKFSPSLTEFNDTKRNRKRIVEDTIRHDENGTGNIGDMKTAVNEALGLSTDEFAAKYQIPQAEFKDTKSNRRKALKQANRDEKTLSREMNSVTFAGDQVYSAKTLLAVDKMTAGDGDYKTVVASAFNNNNEYRQSTIDARRAEERKAKAKALGKAAALTVAGGALGYGLHQIAESTGASEWAKDTTGKAWNGVTNFFDGSDGDSVNTQPERKGIVPGISDGGTPAPGERLVPGISDETLPTPPPEVAPEVSAEAKYLYGNFAGQGFDLRLEQGDTVWGSLREHVLANNPGMSFQEADRITGNMVEHFTTAFKAKNPGYTFNYQDLQADDMLRFVFK